MIGQWKDDEVKNLFAQIEKGRGSNISLKMAFELHAKKYGRKPNSVRNYYYHEIDALGKDKERREKLGIDLDKHCKTRSVYFSKEEEAALMGEIDKLVKDGMSVRGACMTLSKGDAQLLLRYQNKYRNFAIKNRPQQNSKNDNIVAFKKPSKTLSESDVQALFMGLVRLVKRTASIEGEEKYKQKINHANNLLRKALADLQAQEREIDSLKQKYSQLKNENNTLAQNLIRLRCDKASKLREKLKNSKTKFEDIDIKQKEI